MAIERGRLASYKGGLFPKAGDALENTGALVGGICSSALILMSLLALLYAAQNGF